jgi:small nuclear ribonucleoprotein B and B'
VHRLQANSEQSPILKSIGNAGCSSVVTPLGGASGGIEVIMSIPKGNKMLQYVNYRMRVTLDDSRTLVGRFMAFDKHMNIVLADCEEFRRPKKKDVVEKRALGLVLLRGECVVSLSVESPPPPPPKKRPGLGRGETPAGRSVELPGGRGAPLGRGMPPPGLSGPVLGVGAPAAVMQPHVTAAPRMYPTQQAPMVQGPYGHGAVPPLPIQPGMHGMPTAPPGWGRGAGAPLRPMQPPPPYGRGVGPPPHPPPG